MHLMPYLKRSMRRFATHRLASIQTCMACGVACLIAKGETCPDTTPRGDLCGCGNHILSILLMRLGDGPPPVDFLLHAAFDVLHQDSSVRFSGLSSRAKWGYYTWVHHALPSLWLQPIPFFGGPASFCCYVAVNRLLTGGRWRCLLCVQLAAGVNRVYTTPSGASLIHE